MHNQLYQYLYLEDVLLYINNYETLYLFLRNLNILFGDFILLNNIRLSRRLVLQE